ncbi:MAG TPA: hypothetical protein VMV73_00705 [Candidatus Dormibacteraeota bacterium]|nr:hypothetical protein [Candidatus Dormibacteraeota bacterium]
MRNRALRQDRDGRDALPLGVDCDQRRQQRGQGEMEREGGG